MVSRLRRPSSWSGLQGRRAEVVVVQWVATRSWELTRPEEGAAARELAGAQTRPVVRLVVAVALLREA